MQFFQLRSSSALLCWCLALLLSSSRIPPTVAEGDDTGPLSFVRDKFDGLEPRGKFIAGAAAGFVGCRVALGSAVTAIKVGAAAFLTAEVLHQTGVLDYHDIMEDHHDALTKVKDTCMKQADYFRVSVRRRLNPSAIQAWVEQEKMAAMGLASGALVGLVL